MSRLAIVHGLTYTDIAQVRRRWLIPSYAISYRWTGNRADAEDLTAWIFHNLGGGFSGPEPLHVVEAQLGQLTSEAIHRHWSDRYGIAGVSHTGTALADPRPTLEDLTAGLTAEMHLMLVRRFVRRQPVATIANRFGVSVPEADRRIFDALARVAERIVLPRLSTIAPELGQVSAFVNDLVAASRPVRFEARTGVWPMMVAACHVQAAIAGNDLPTQRFVQSLETSPRRFVTALRISSA
ncbi:MAG TPA: hypothetical protein VGV88_01065 [Candidatus Dormibacteraeota bacterium]|nr:hypothetical protein [Candidatus Dormibacteraeota bacterium]